MKSNTHGVPGCDCELMVDLVFETGSYRLSLNLKVPATQSYEKYRCEPMDTNPYSYFQMLFNSVEDAKRDAPEMNTDRLRGHGAQLAEKLLPRELQARFWNLAGGVQGRLPRLHIISNESSIPWELMRIRDPARGKLPSFFLVERFAITRWITGEPGCTHLPLRRLAVVAPRDSGLPSTALEKNTILDLTSGRGSREVPAKAATVLAAMESGHHEGWHFAGHGLAPGNFPDTWAIRLEDGRHIQVSDLADLAGLGAGKPLVFLNSCRSGRGAYVLNRVDGWAQTFVQQAGAGAFIGTHWAISDVPAAEFAITFYRSFLGGASISDAIHEARQQIRDKYKNDPTWLAYTVFAHPEAICAVPESGSDPPATQENESSAPAQVAGAAAEVLRGGPEAPGEAPQTRTWPSGRVAASIAGFALLVFLLWLVASRPERGIGGSNRRPAVSVLTFQNLKPESSELDWLSAALPEVVSAELGFDKAVRVIDREEVAAAEMSLDIPPGEPSAESLARLKVLLGTESFVFGSYKNIGDSSQVELEVGLWRLPDESPVWRRRKFFDAAAWNRLNEGLASVDGEISLRRALGVPELTASQSEQVIASFPQQQEAARHFGEGLAHFQRYAFRQANESLSKALGFESHARIALSQAQVLIRRRRLAEALATLEAAASGKTSLPFSEQFEWNLANAKVEPDGRDLIRANRALYEEFFRDDLSRGLNLVSLLADKGEVANARQLLEEIGQLLPEESSNPNLAIEAARIELSSGTVDAAGKHAANAIAQARIIEAAWQESAARNLMASILLQLGQESDAFASHGEAERLMKRFGPEIDPGYFFNELLARIENTRDPEKAVDYLRLGLADAEKLGNKTAQARVLAALSRALLVRGDLAGSQEAARKAEELGSSLLDDGDGHSEVRLGYQYFLAGDLPKAQAHFNRASEVFSFAGDNINLAIVSLNLGELAIQRGFFAAAAEHFQAARAVLEDSDSAADLAYVNLLSGVLHWASGDDVEVAAELAAAAENLGALEELSGAEASLRLAELHLTSDRPVSCRKTAQPLLPQLEKGGAWNLLGYAYAILGRCHLLEGRRTEARELLTLASKLEFTDFRATAQLRLAQAHLSAAEGRPGEAVRDLIEYEKKAETRDHYLFALEARLAAGEIELRYGDRDQGIEWLHSLVHQAWRGKRSLVGQVKKRALAALGAAKALQATGIPASGEAR